MGWWGLGRYVLKFSRGTVTAAAVPQRWLRNWLGTRFRLISTAHSCRRREAANEEGFDCGDGRGDLVNGADCQGGCHRSRDLWERGRWSMLRWWEPIAPPALAFDVASKILDLLAGFLCRLYLPSLCCLTYPSLARFFHRFS